MQVPASSLRRMLVPLTLARFICSFAGRVDPKGSYGIAMIVLALLGLIGLAATILLPAAEPFPETDVPASTVEHPV
jgi:hypothetical protein